MHEDSCLLCGVGGQGTVLASRIIAAAAMAKGLDARTAETIGMAQRGGSVVSHVRIGEDGIASPTDSRRKRGRAHRISNPGSGARTSIPEAGRHADRLPAGDHARDRGPGDQRLQRDGLSGLSVGTGRKMLYHRR